MDENVKVLHKIKVFISSGCGKGKEKYNAVRKTLKDKIEKTGIASVYLWEDEQYASTLTAEQNYLREIDECHVCIFLIDNKDGIFQGVAPEIQRAKATKTKSIFLFCTEHSTDPTWAEKELYGAKNPKLHYVDSFSDFPDSAYNSLINDIVEVYHRYCRNWLIDHELDIDEKKIYEVKSIEDISLTKTLVSNLDKTKIYLSKGICDNHRKEEQSSTFDECCFNFLKVILGEKSFLEFNPSILLLELKKIQSASLHSVVTKRWEAISFYYTNDLIRCIEHLEEALDIAKRENLPTWLISDILIDLRNVLNLKSNVESKYYIENKAQNQLKEQSVSVYFPLLDRLDNNFYKKLEDGRNNKILQSPYTINFGNNIDSFSDCISCIFAIAVFYGSITQMLQTYVRLKDLAFYLCNRYDDWEFRVLLLKYTAISTNRKTMDETVKAFNEILGKVNSTDTIDIYNIVNAEPILYKRFIIKLSVLEVLGYYFSDDDYKKITDEVLDEVNLWINSENPNVFLARSIFKMLNNNHLRMNNDIILDICLDVMNKKFYRFLDDVFDIIYNMGIENISTAKKINLVNQLILILSSENKDKLSLQFNKAIIRVRKNLNEKDDSLKLDIAVKEYLPEFYENDYSLELLSETEVEIQLYIDRYIDSIHRDNDEQGKYGSYSGHGSDLYITLINIFKSNTNILNEEIIKKTISAIEGTIFAEKQTIITKINAFNLLTVLKIKFTNYNFIIDPIYVKIKDKENIVLSGKDLIIEKSSFLILNLSYFLFLLSYESTKKTQVIDICASLAEAEEFEKIEATYTISKYFKIYDVNNLKLYNIYPILSLLLTFTTDKYHSVRYYSISALINMLSKDTYSPIVTQLSRLMDFESMVIKSKIIDHIADVRNFDKVVADGILQKAKVDTNYIIKKKVLLI